MQVEKSRLGLDGNTKIDIINVKCDADMVGLLTQTYGFLPGYHMNKKYWITMLLDGTVSEAKILDFLDMSYDLIDGNVYVDIFILKMSDAFGLRKGKNILHF